MICDRVESAIWWGLAWAVWLAGVVVLAVWLALMDQAGNVVERLDDDP